MSSTVSSGRRPTTQLARQGDQGTQCPHSYSVFTPGECECRYEGSLYGACRSLVVLAKARGPVVEVRVRDSHCGRPPMRRSEDLLSSSNDHE
eukprot:scaffold7860_cov37-Prasinocladus_malaysianus.AAC.1